MTTEQFVQLDHMTNEERKIYDLVVRRFLSVLYPPFEYEQTTIKSSAAGECFIAKGKIVRHAGWKEVYEGNWSEEEETEEESRPKEQTLPELKKGQKLSVGKVDLVKDQTKPPAHFNEATLLSAMENPVKYMETHDAKAARTNFRMTVENTSV